MLKYLITDPKYYTNNPKTFKDILSKALKNKKVDIACFRDKISPNFEELAEIFVKACKESNIQNILINSNISLALKLETNGIHLTSTQFDKIQMVKDNNLFVIISCHTHNDIQKAIDNGADMVTYSPIFSTPNKGEPKGCEDLRETIDKFNIPVIALGGIISQEQIKQIASTNAKGFASIRYFIPQ